MIFTIEFVEKDVGKALLHQSSLIPTLLRLLSGDCMAHHDLTKDQMEILSRTLDSETKSINIRLRKGEYQFDLAKEIASQELQLKFPNAKDLVRRLYGEEKEQNTRFMNKIQTILKKMEKSGVVQILPKNKPWELQKYALLSFKFQDVEKNLIALGTDDQIKQARNLLHSEPAVQGMTSTEQNYIRIKIFALVLVAIISYATIMWTLTQPIVNVIILIIAFGGASVCSLLLGLLLARR